MGKLTFKDLIQALKRSELYLRDLEKYLDYNNKNNIRDVYFLGEFLTPVPLKKLSIAAQKLCKKYNIPYPINPYDTSILEKLYNPAVVPLPLKDLTFGLDDARFLTVQIDMTRPEEDIRADLKKLYKYYSGQINDNTRNKKTQVDPWEVYDRVQKGENPLQIAKSKFKVAGNPSYDSDVDKYRKQVERALKAAERMIKVFESKA